MVARFTVDGTDALELQIASDMTKISDATLAALGTENLTALILGGGYGRGEGGVYVQDGKERVYNDYDFFVVVPFLSRRKQRWVSKRLRTVKDDMEPQCGIHVDFSGPMPFDALPQYPYELIFMEAKLGHRVIAGLEDVLSRLPSYDPSHVPLEEGARLLMNRGVGLLLARRLLDSESPLDREKHEFVVRNMYKAMMAMGDCLLMLKGAYSPSYVERRRRFSTVDTDDAPEPMFLRATYDAALSFKLRPTHDVPPEKTLDTWYEEILAQYDKFFLWYEQRRLGIPKLTWKEYRRLNARLPRGDLCETGKNIVRNLGTMTGDVLSPGNLLLHPRDRILIRLPELLFEGKGDSKKEETVLQLWERYV